MSTLPTIRALIDQRAVQYPCKPFLLAAHEGDESGAVGSRTDRLTFQELRDACRTLEVRFRAVGLQPGDVVSVFMGNGIQTARLLLAAMYSGLVAHPVNLLCQPSQLRYIVEHSDTRMIFVGTAMRETMAAVLADMRTMGFTRDIVLVHAEPDARELPTLTPAEPARTVAAEAGAVQLSARRASARTTAAASTDRPRTEEVALLMYTSGTTGVPKGVLLTQRNLVTNSRNITAEHRLRADDRVLASLPFYHINGLVVTLLAPLFHGGSVVTTPRFSVRTFWRDVARYGCTWINVVPAIVACLLNGSESRPFDLRALKFCRCASAALPADHHRSFEARFGVGVIETMGMTETAAPMFSNPYDSRLRKIGSVGLPSGGEAKVIDRSGRECAPYERGELVLRGEQVMSGYYKRPEETRAAFTADGWLRTGDLGYRDDDGYFYVDGRAKELIIKGGENIAPREIDEALLRHPGVLEAAAVGVPDAIYGQEIVAFVVLRFADGQGKPDAEDLHAHCLRELGRYKTPKAFRFVVELPRGPSGKVQRLKLLQDEPDAAGIRSGKSCAT